MASGSSPGAPRASHASPQAVTHSHPLSQESGANVYNNICQLTSAQKAQEAPQPACGSNPVLVSAFADRKQAFGVKTSSSVLFRRLPEHPQGRGSAATGPFWDRTRWCKLTAQLELPRPEAPRGEQSWVPGWQELLGAAQTRAQLPWPALVPALLRAPSRSDRQLLRPVTCSLLPRASSVRWRPRCLGTLSGAGGETA